MKRWRRVPRQKVRWSAKCLIEDEPLAGWHVCKVLDISVIGIGIEVYDYVGDDPLGHTMTIEVQAPEGRTLQSRFAGEVRNTCPGALGGLQLGVEFTGISEAERAILELMESMHVAW